MRYAKHTDLLAGRSVWIIRIDNDFTGDLTLLISKVSEAITPAMPGNHIGAGAAMDEIIPAQPGIRFIINGGFSHYRKDFYDWPHQDFQVGDPVGVVKIRDHYYEDFRDIQGYGFFVQNEKRAPWRIIRYADLNKTEKYVLGCTPLLIWNSEALALTVEKMQPLAQGTITPPSILAHGLQNHPRTAIGIQGRELVFVMVEGEGCTLPELQHIGLQLELDAFLNLDGGGSSQFRLWDGTQYIKNAVSPEDEKRVLGHVLILFDESLK